LSLKALALIGWTCFALDVLFVVMMFATRNVGDDAAGRGMATGFGIILTPIVLLAGGALWWAQRSGSFGGVLVATLLVGFPFLVLAKNVAMGPLSAIERHQALGEGVRNPSSPTSPRSRRRHGPRAHLARPRARHARDRKGAPSASP
jgi:hypothetical protein